MMHPHDVLVTLKLPERAVQALREGGCRVDLFRQDRPMTHGELLLAVRGKHAVLCQVADRIDQAVLAAAAPPCCIFANAAVGYENFDLDAARRRRVWLSNTPDVLTEATADLAWALLLAAARRLGEAERCLRAGRWPGWRFDQFLGLDLHGRTLGVVGFGRIGRAVARRAGGFGMRVLYHNRSEVPADQAGGAESTPLDALLSASDFVSINVPLTPQTRRLIGPRELALMKPTAVLVNTARGAVIDEAALAAALRERRIAAAGLDVFEREPQVHPGLLELDNAVLLPHIGSATEMTRLRMATTAVENILAAVAGRRPPNALVERGE